MIRALRRNIEVIAKLKGTTTAALVKELKEKESQGVRVTGATKADIDRWRAIIRLSDSVVNTGVGAYNYLLRPLSLFTLQPLSYRHTPLPLNTAEILEDIFLIHGHQILDGSFNGDPHPGNIVRLGDDDDDGGGEIIIIAVSGSSSSNSSSSTDEGSTCLMTRVVVARFFFFNGASFSLSPSPLLRCFWMMDVLD